MMEVSGQLYDGTPFSIRAQEHHVLPNEKVEGDKSVDGFLRVEHVGEQHDRAIVVLPAPDIKFGKNITVKTHDLYPENVSINDFIR